MGRTLSNPETHSSSSSFPIHRPPLGSHLSRRDLGSTSDRSSRSQSSLTVVMVPFGLWKATRSGTRPYSWPFTWHGRGTKRRETAHDQGIAEVVTKWRVDECTLDEHVRLRLFYNPRPLPETTPLETWKTTSRDRRNLLSF